MVRRHLAAVDRLMAAHDLLYEGVARFGLHRDAILAGYDVLGIPNHSGVMNNLRAALLSLRKWMLGALRHIRREQIDLSHRKRSSDQNRRQMPRQSRPSRP